jgi:hypothetical protein
LETWESTNLTGPVASITTKMGAPVWSAERRIVEPRHFVEAWFIYRLYGFGAVSWTINVVLADHSSRFPL